MQEKININGRKLNKLEETVKLVKKLNEEWYDTEEKGYPLYVVINADGSGAVEQRDWPETIYTFDCLETLNAFLNATQLQKAMLLRNNGYAAGRNNSSVLQGRGEK